MTGSVKAGRRYRWLIGGVAAILLLGVGGVAFFARQSPLVLDGVDVEATTAVTSDETGYTVRYAPDGKVILRLYLTNSGRFPVRLDGIVAPWVPVGDPENMFVSAFYKAEPLLYDGATQGPFHPISVPANGSVSVGFRLTMCPAGTSGSDDGHMTMQQIDLVYSYAGWRRTHRVDLTQTLSAPFYKCDYTGAPA
jgi:hypothetical protein